ncbi:MAG: FxDxF family PEP-CTERM protein [Nitrosospira sp.]|nr:FxDxF family PEP-CTERM protein [Nitrosospira sp.]MDN5880901.1 FxDxF family PEP-CTERM protein [Nitrosospira sp.]MDN5935033.1 FxDxF family PEP-CTERM protein [Nitrosospira sp.]
MINSTLKQAVAVAILAGASVGAHAAAIDAGTVRSNVPTSFNGIMMGGAATGLNDTVLFTPEVAAINSGFSVMDFPITLVDDDGGDNDTFALELATVILSSTGADGMVGGGDDAMLKTVSYTDVGNSNSHISFSYDEPLSATPYYLNIVGVTSGTDGGAYSGSIEITPVPEPESFAMLLAGLGLMGAVVRRRSNKTS